MKRRVYVDEVDRAIRAPTQRERAAALVRVATAARAAGEQDGRAEGLRDFYRNVFVGLKFEFGFQARTWARLWLRRQGITPPISFPPPVRKRTGKSLNLIDECFHE